MCYMHRNRVARHGSPDVVRLPQRKDALKGYRVIQQPDHPLAGALGEIYEHRMVLYEALGGGEHPCHWCGRLVAWSTDVARNRLVVDHLDGVKYNNTLDNLVPSCTGCNTLRSGHANSKKTHCPQGHPYSGDNLDIDRDGHRRCRACKAEKQRTRDTPRQRERRRAAREARAAA